MRACKSHNPRLSRLVRHSSQNQLMRTSPGRNPRRSRLVPLLFLLLLGTSLLASSCQTPLSWSDYSEDLSLLSGGEWQHDIDVLVRELARHPKLAASPETRARVNATAAGVRSSLDAVSDPDRRRDAALAGIAKILAAVGDGHTRINASPKAGYPAYFRFFPKGSGHELRLVATDSGHADYLGAAVLGIGGLPVADFLAILEPALSLESALLSPGLESLRKAAINAEAPEQIRNASLMRGLGLAGLEGLEVDFDPETLSAGTAPTVTFTETTTLSWTRLLDSAPATPLSRQNPASGWWADQPEGRPDILYFAYKDCDSGATATMNSVLSRIDSDTRIQRLIVDLRSNSGGDSRPGSTFASRLGKSRLASVKGGVVVLIGPVTFSSALMNAADILKSCGASGDPASGNAILAGESLVEPMNHYGHITRFGLPESRLVIGRSTRLWNYSAMSGIRPETGFLAPPPEWTRTYDFEEYRAGRDPALELAMGTSG